MATTYVSKDYSVTGPECAQAQEKGLASAEWYTSPIPRQRLKELMQRKDGPAIRDTLIWMGALLGPVFLRTSLGAPGGRFRRSLYMGFSMPRRRIPDGMNAVMEQRSGHRG